MKLAAFTKFKAKFPFRFVCHQMTLISNLKGPFHGQPIVLIPNKLYFASYETGHLPNNDEHCVYIPIIEYVHYDAFYDDFGPYNLAVLYRFIKALDVLLKSKEKRKVVCCSSSDERNRVNGAYLMAGFMILIAGYSAEKALSLVIAAQPPPFIAFRDASLGSPIYHLSLHDCIKSIEKAIKFKWFDFQTFDPDEYEQYERVENGDFNWIIPNKILSFCGPHNQSYIEDEYPYHSPETYFEYFKKHNISTIVRLNKKLYNASRFTNAGFEHFDLFFIDGSTPSDEIVDKFIDIVDKSRGGVAIHCKAGLGRTGTLIACWMMKEFKVSASICMAWLRICRPGSVIGPQQLFLIEKQSYCWNWKAKTRSLSPKTRITEHSPKSTNLIIPRPSIENTPMMTRRSLKTKEFDESATNKLGQTQGDRLLTQKARHQHQGTPNPTIVVPQLGNTKITPKYSSATTPIKQLKVSSKRMPPILSKTSASRALQPSSSSNNNFVSPPTTTNYFPNQKSGNIPISRVTVSSTTASSLRPSTKTQNVIKKHSPTRTHPYPPSTTSLSNNLSKINLISKYELRPRRTLHSPQRFEPGKSFSPTSSSILARLSVSPKTKQTIYK